VQFSYVVLHNTAFPKSALDAEISVPVHALPIESARHEICKHAPVTVQRLHFPDHATSGLERSVKQRFVVFVHGPH